jgi:hypothetical protein
MDRNIEPIQVGVTIVRVMRKTIVDEQARKETIDKIHEGIVVQDLGSSVRVFNPLSQDKGGDVAPETAELFALQSKLVWCEYVGDRRTSFPIPVTLR